MLEHISLTNFKAFREMPQPLELKPITMLAGANSSGKSSIIHALLLLKQTLESPRKRSLSLTGEFLNFSRYEEIVFGKQADRSVTFDLKLSNSKLPAPLTGYLLSRFFSDAEVNSILEEASLEATYQFTFNLNQPEGHINLQAVNISSELTGARQQAEMDLKYTDGRYIGTVLMPDTEGIPHSYTAVEVEWSQFLPERYQGIRRGQADSTEVPLDLFVISNLQAELTERLHYVGPLRSEPQRAYFIFGDRLELDHRGENSAQILWLEKDKPVEYLIDDQKESLALLDAVNRTLAMMGLPQSIAPISREDVVSQLMLPLIGDDAQQVTIVDVGFGVGQLLPIVVAGLRAKRGDLLIFEQPETHLHPRIQASLASFFVLLTRLGKRVLVETHSDHLINGLRQQIAGDLEDELELAAKIHIVFVRPPRDREVGASIETLEFDEYGLVANWPPEFLPQSMVEVQELLRAAAAKRRAGFVQTT